MRDVLADQGTAPEAKALHPEAYACVITKDHLVAFAAGAILAALAMWSIHQPKHSSERMRRLERDSADYVQDKEAQAKKYARIDSAYQYDMSRLSFALDSILRARAARPRPRINDADSLRIAILRELYGTRGERPAGLPPLPR